MAFVTKEWKARLVEYAGRRKLKNVSTNEEMVVDVTRNEGRESQVGDAFSPANMNDLEQRIKTEFDSVNDSLNGNILLTEGSGANTKYYIQKGADTASKKLLGKSKIVSIGSASNSAYIQAGDRVLYYNFSATSIIGYQDLTISNFIGSITYIDTRATDNGRCYIKNCYVSAYNPANGNVQVVVTAAAEGGVAGGNPKDKPAVFENITVTCYATS